MGLGVFLVDGIGKGGYAAPIRQVYPQDAVAQHAVRVVHGVYVALGRDRAQGIIRLLVGEDGVVLEVEAARVLRDELRAEVRNGGNDHVAAGSGGFCEPFVELRLRLAYVEHVDANGSGPVLRVRVQRLDGHGHDVPAPGLIGADVVYGALVDAYDEDVPSSASGF